MASLNKKTMELAKLIIAELDTLPPKRKRGQLYCQKSKRLEKIVAAVGKRHSLYGGNGRHSFPGMRKSTLYRRKPVVEDTPQESTGPSIEDIAKETMALFSLTKEQAFEQLQEAEASDALTLESPKSDLIAALVALKLGQ